MSETGGAYLLRDTNEGSFTDRYCKAVARGLNKTHAAQAAGCDPSTVRAWERAAEETEGVIDSPEATFLTAVKAARLQLIEGCIDKVTEAVEGGSWRAAIWMLQRNGYRGAPADD